MVDFHFNVSPQGRSVTAGVAGEGSGVWRLHYSHGNSQRGRLNPRYHSEKSTRRSRVFSRNLSIASSVIYPNRCASDRLTAHENNASGLSCSIIAGGRNVGNTGAGLSERAEGHLPRRGSAAPIDRQSVGTLPDEHPVRVPAVCEPPACVSGPAVDKVKAAQARLATARARYTLTGDPFEDLYRRDIYRAERAWHLATIRHLRCGGVS